MQTFRYGWVQGLKPHQIIRTQFSSSFSSVLTSFSRRCSPYGSSQQLQTSIFLILIARNICKSLSFPIIPLKIPGSNCILVTELINQCHSANGKWLAMLESHANFWTCWGRSIPQSYRYWEWCCDQKKGKEFGVCTSNQCPLSILSLLFLFLFIPGNIIRSFPALFRNHFSYLPF